MSQVLKRSKRRAERRAAVLAAKQVNKRASQAPSGEVVIHYVIPGVNARQRKYALKRGLLAEKAHFRLQDALKALPTAWSEQVRVVLP